MIAIFMRSYSKMVILNNGVKKNIIRMMPMHAYPFGNIRFRFINKFSGGSFFSVADLLVFKPMTSASAGLMMM